MFSMKRKMNPKGYQADVFGDASNTQVNIATISSANFNRDLTLGTAPLNQGVCVVLFYRDSCPHCVHFKPNFIQAAQRDNATSYVLFDVAAPENKKLMDILYDEKSGAPITIEGVPTVAGFVNGKFAKTYEPSQNPSVPQYRTPEGVIHFSQSLNGNGGASQKQMMQASPSSSPTINSTHFDRNFKLNMPGKTVIMFYRDTCPACAAFKPNYLTAMKAAQSNNMPINFVLFDTSDAQNQQFMEALTSDKSMAPFILEGVPTVVGYNNGQFYSMYGPGNDPQEPPYRSVEGVLYYGSTIGSAPVYMKS